MQLLIRCFVFASMIAASDCSVSPKNQSAISDTPSELDGIATRIQTVFSQQIARGKNVGAIVGIYDHGEVRFLALGETKRGTNQAPDEKTVFEIGSLTQTFTGLFSISPIQHVRWIAL